MLFYKIFNRFNWVIHKPYYLFCKRRTNKIVNQIKNNKKVVFGEFDKNCKIVVSVATIKERFDTVAYTLVSLLKQKKYYSKLILNISNEFSLKDLPYDLLSLRNYGLEIYFIEGPDLGPHNKYFYTAKKFGDEYKIITFDDDFYYDYSIIKKLHKVSEKHENMICANRIHIMKFNHKKLMPYKNWFYEYNGWKRQNTFSFFTTGGGTLFPKGYLKHDLLSTNKIKNIKYADDIYLNIYFIKKEKPIYKAGYFSVRSSMFSGSQEVGLCHNNIDFNRNDLYINIALGLFDIEKEQLYNIILKRGRYI